MLKIVLINIILFLITTSEKQSRLSYVLACPLVECSILDETDKWGEPSTRSHHYNRVGDFEWKPELRSRMREMKTLHRY